MNDFILELKLKGSSPLELKTDFVALGNEVVSHRYLDLVFTPAAETIKNNI